MEKIIRKFSSHEEQRLFHIEGWQNLNPATRLTEAWGLVINYRELHNIQPIEPRLQRTVTSIRRTGR
jgi:hypothetical protein